MNPTRILFIVSLLVILTTKGQGQSTYRGCYGFDCKEKKWNLSIFAGFSLLGPGQKIVEQMITSGFGDVGPDFELDDWFATTDYPVRSIGTSWNIAVGYDISKKSGLQLTGGNSYATSVEGYDDIGNGNHLRIKSNIWTASFNYVYKLRKGKDGFSLGPSLANYTTKAYNEKGNGSQVSGTSSWKTGFNAGYAFSLVQKKSWFLSANVNYTWLPDAEIGPFTVEHKLGVLTENPDIYTSTFHKTNVSLSNINFGISTGFKF